jgi:hypothetical protein
MVNNHPTPAVLSEIDQLCCAIGHVVVQWGFVEHNLTLCQAWIYSNYGGKKILKEPKMEKFSRKQIKFMCKCFNKLDSLAHFKDEGLALLDRVTSLINERDAIIHSTFGGIYKNSFNFIKFDFSKPQNIYVAKLNRTINSILETRKKIELLAADIGRFGLRLAGKSE